MSNYHPLQSCASQPLFSIEIEVRILCATQLYNKSLEFTLCSLYVL